MNVLNIKAGTRITVKMLEAIDACPSEVTKFKDLWPKGVALRKKSLLQAAGAEMDINWFAHAILTHDGRWPEVERYDNLYLATDRLAGTNYDAAYSLWEMIRRRE